VSYTTARYYVSVNGVKVGWVTKIQDREWRFYREAREDEFTHYIVQHREPHA
jgi:hypothetical protein